MNKIPQIPLREIMLDAHEIEFRIIYDIPKHEKVHYNADSTQICVSDIPLFDYLAEKLFDSGFVSHLAQIREERRTKILDAHLRPQDYASEDLFHLQFDYELLAIDHLVDTKLAGKIANNMDSEINRYYARNYFLAPSSGKTFFEEVYIKELESLGHLLLKQDGCSSEKDFFFEDKGFHHFIKHTMTREKLIKIILDYDSVVSRLNVRYDSLVENYSCLGSTSEVYDKIKEIRIEQIRQRGARQSLFSKLRPQEQTYISFVGNALDFNEENRLLRSISFYHIMKDEKIGERFYELIESRKKWH